MSAAPSPTEPSYRDQLTGWIQALAAARDELVQPALDEGSSTAQVRLFLESNRAGRREKLLAHLDFLAPAFHDFDDRIDAYLRERPLAAYDSIAADAERWLDWAAGRGELSPEQRDYLACQRARLAVEAAARRDRAGHRRFQQLWSATAGRAADLGDDRRLRLHLNPIRASARFLTLALLDEDATPPADVLCFAVREEIATAVLEPAAWAQVEALGAFGPRTLDEWAGRIRPGDSADRAELIALGSDLAELGLVALE